MVELVTTALVGWAFLLAVAAVAEAVTRRQMIKAFGYRAAEPSRSPVRFASLDVSTIGRTKPRDLYCCRYPAASFHAATFASIWRAWFSRWSA